MTENRDLGCVHSKAKLELSFCLRLFSLLWEILFRTKGSGDKIIYEAQEMRWRLHLSFITERIAHCSSEEQDRSITAYQQTLLLLSDNTNLLQNAGGTPAPAENPAAASAELSPHPPSYAWCTRLKSRSACDLSSGSRCLSGWYSMHSRRYAALSSSCDACERSESRLRRGRRSVPGTGRAGGTRQPSPQPERTGLLIDYTR